MTTFYDLAIVKNPNLLKEWDINNDISPKDVKPFSHKMIWWVCSNCGYRWEESPAKRWISGCPNDAGKVLNNENSLKVNFPEIAEEYHPTKNEANVETQFAYSNKKVWWICKTCNNEWEAIINNRTGKNRGCPHCVNRKINDKNNLAATHPEIIKEWHPTKNLPRTPFDVVFGSTIRAWWICSICNYEWNTEIRVRVKSGCPGCSGHALTDKNRLSLINPEISKEWHPIKNEKTPDQIHQSSNKKAWWQCIACNYEWESTVNNRTNGNQGCPNCVGMVVNENNNLAINFQHLVKEWHEKNKTTPDKLHQFSNKKAWWMCSICNYEWEAIIASRTINNQGCPACANKVVTDKNRLTKTNPELIKEWHPTKNLPLLPEDVSYGLAKKVWWKCSRPKCGHEWLASLNLRSRGRGCPSCHIPSKLELLLLSELEFIFGEDNITHQFRCLKYLLDIKLKNHSVGIEFDGYYHVGEEHNDLIRRSNIEQTGIMLFSLRDNYLKLLSERDINTLRKERIIKKDIDSLLKLMMITYDGFSCKEKSNIETYLKKDGFCNTKKYHKYVFK